MEFYKRAFGAKENERFVLPNGQLMHAQIQIGNSIIMLSQEMPDWGALAPATLKGNTGGLYLYVDDCDAWFNRAVQAGAQVRMPLVDMFWGDRMGQVADPSGHAWTLATHKKDLTPEGVRKGQEEFIKQAVKQKVPA